MNRITIVGLGPGDSEYLTMNAINVLKKSEKVFIRTEKHPTNEYLKSLGIEYETFDVVYESSETFDDVYEEIVNKLIFYAKEDPITYAVPGNPFVAEKTVELLIEKYENIEFVYGVSFIDAVISVLKLDPVKGLSVIDALSLHDISNRNHNMIIQVYNQMVAANLKTQLSRYYSDDQEVYIIKSAGVKAYESVIKRKLWELDHYNDYDHLTTLVIYPVEENLRLKNMDDLVEIMRVLRGDNGCPWDRKQTHKSLKKYLIEETYEVFEAIDKEDSKLLEEELGDLLLQIVFHGLIEEEMGYFNLDDITNSICEKLIRRHPHVFGNLSANTPEEVEKIWNAVKKEEKSKDYSSRMNEISKSSPVLFRAMRVQKIAKEVGFDWDDAIPAINKIHEEIKELQEAIDENEVPHIEEELGDLFFAVVNVARLLKVDSEIALDKSTSKFIKRFNYIEYSQKAKDKGLRELSLEEMELLWEKSKKMLKK